MSRNGRNKWQTMVTVEKCKTYLGSQNDPILAARIYDIALIQNSGLKVKEQIRSCQSNFQYTKAELLAILFEHSLIFIKTQ